MGFASLHKTFSQNLLGTDTNEPIPNWARLHCDDSLATAFELLSYKLTSRIHPRQSRSRESFHSMAQWLASMKFGGKQAAKATRLGGIKFGFLYFHSAEYTMKRKLKEIRIWESVLAAEMFFWFFWYKKSAGWKDNLVHVVEIYFLQNVLLYEHLYCIR